MPVDPMNLNQPLFPPASSLPAETAAAFPAFWIDRVRTETGWNGPIDIQAVPAGFSGARVLKVCTASGDFAFRRWPNSGMPVQRLAGLHRLLRAAAVQGITQLPVPIRLKSGSTWRFDFDSLWQLEPWMPGNADFRQSPSPEKLSAAVRLLARFHLSMAHYTDPDAREWFHISAAEPSPAVKSRFQRLMDWRTEKVAAVRQKLPTRTATADAEGLLRILNLLIPHIAGVRSELGRRLELRFRLQSCLRDPWHDHFLFTGSALTGLIDPAAAAVENVACDLARMLGSLVPDRPDEWQFALREYRTVAPFTLEEERLLASLDRSGTLLSALGWIERIANGSARLTPRIRERLEGFARRIDAWRRLSND